MLLAKALVNMDVAQKRGSVSGIKRLFIFVNVFFFSVVFSLPAPHLSRLPAE